MFQCFERRHPPRVATLLGILLLAGSGTSQAQTRTRSLEQQPAPTRNDSKSSLIACTLRPTVMIRKGNGRGTGTIIASIPRDTLILTAAHVVQPDGDLQVEIHRLNLGHGTSLTEGGGWPRLIPAEIVAADPSTDVAVVRIRSVTALPFVAKLDVQAREPAGEEVVLSVGIDNALHLIPWKTRVKGSARLEVRKGSGVQRFTVTEKPSRSGRSGGGLFRADGTLVGVCVGHTESSPIGSVGIFASMQSVRRILQENHLVASIPTVKPPQSARSTTIEKTPTPNGGDARAGRP